MSRRKKDPLREITPEKRKALDQLSRSQVAPAVEVARASMIPPVDRGDDYQDVAHSWCPTGNALRRRKARAAAVVDPDATSKKVIEASYLLGEAPGLSVRCNYQAAPIQRLPYPGQSWRREGGRCGGRTNSTATARPRS